MQYNENKHITLAKVNEINYSLKSYIRGNQKQAKQNILLYYSTMQTKL